VAQEPQTQELKSAEELHRFEASMMLGQTAVYLVASGALLNAIGGKDVSAYGRIAISLYGILLSVAFLLIVHRTGINLRGARRRAEELSEDLSFKLYSSEYSAPMNKYLVGKNATKTICICGGILWVGILLKLLHT
jgi:hypothetical protein